MRRSPDKRAFSLLALALALAAGCGGEPEPGLLPEDSAAALEQLLDAAEQRFEDGECDRIAPTLERLDAEIDGLPDAQIDGSLRRALNEEVVELGELSERCREAPEETVSTPAPTTEEVDPAPVAPDTTEEETTEEEERTEARERPEPDRRPEPAPDPPPEPPQSPPQPPQEPPEEQPPGDPCSNDSPLC